MPEITELAPPLEAVIDYVDAQGEASRRNIMVFQITRDGPKTLLECKDMDIGQTRTFRLDRIDCFIDGDGVCHEPNAFIAPYMHVFVQPQPRAQAPAQAPKRRKISKAAVGFWTLIAMITALSALMAKDEGVGVGIAGFVMFAGPVFLLRWIWRFLVNRFQA